jgi:DNA-binding NarL/FixJ family response regulator
MEAETIRILIVDDHAVVRAGLKQMISEEPNMTVQGEADNGQRALDMLAEKPYDLVVMDLSMPGLGGMGTLKQINTLFPRLPVLMLSMHPENQFGIQVIRAGASGYICKQSAPDNLIRAIRHVATGRKYVSESLAERLANELRWTAGIEPYQRLSDRELAVMRGIASGKTISELAEILSIRVKTVCTYRERLLNKLQLKNNAEITHYVISNHLLD